MANHFPSKQTLIVKIGTASVSDGQGLPNDATLRPLVEQISQLRAAGNKLLLVTSGAVGVGRSLLGWDQAKKLTVPEKRYASMVGQPELMAYYARLYASCGLAPLAQGLLTNCSLTRDVPHKQKNVLEALKVAFSIPMAVPILNENDFESHAELKPLSPRDPDIFSDNDQLAALIGGLTQAHQIALVSTDCVYTCPPEDPAAQRVPFINFAQAYEKPKTDGTSQGGRGGMGHKLETMRHFVQCLEACGKRTVHILPAACLAQNGLVRAFSGDKEVGTRLFCAADQETRQARRNRFPYRAQTCCVMP